MIFLFLPPPSFLYLSYVVFVVRDEKSIYLGKKILLKLINMMKNDPSSCHSTQSILVSNLSAPPDDLKGVCV